MTTPPHQSAAETRSELTRELEIEGAHSWAVCMKGSEYPLGWVRFLGQVSIPGMGYMLHPDYWNQGITTEACQAALAYGFERLRYVQVELWIDEDNGASIRVAHKLGFKLRGLLPLKYNHQTVHRNMLVYGKTAIEEDPAARFYRAEPVLLVRNVEKSANFYRDILGFKIDFLYGDPLTHAGVSRREWTGSGVTIQLSRAPEEQPVLPARALHILVGTGLDALFETYRQRGAAVVRAPASQPWGMRDFAIQDLDGHMLTFATHL